MKLQTRTWKKNHYLILCLCYARALGAVVKSAIDFFFLSVRVIRGLLGVWLALTGCSQELTFCVMKTQKDRGVGDYYIFGLKQLICYEYMQTPLSL